MKLHNTLRWLTGLTLAITAMPTSTEAQDRDRKWRHRSTFAMPNMFVQRASKARLGLYLDARQSRRYDEQGTLITDVMHGSPAEDVGLRDGDIITACDGQSLTASLADRDLEDGLDLDESLPAQRVLALARAVEPGQTVEITYLRDGESETVEVVAEEFDFPKVVSFGGGDGNWTVDIDAGQIERRAKEMAERMQNWGGRLADGGGFSQSYALFRGDCQGSMNSWGRDTRGCAAGVEFRELNPRLGEYFDAESGVLVIDVNDDAALGLMPGDVVVAVGAREGDTVDRVRRLINSYEEDEPIRLTIIRKGAEQVIEGSLMPH